MVKLMLDGFGGDWRKKRTAPAACANLSTMATTGPGGIQCYHVNAQCSEALEQIGVMKWGKALLVFRYCLEAVWCRFQYGVDTFYYVPAPGKRVALYRDWMVMLFCRPFFRRFVHHWHAAGLGDWLAEEGTWLERWITHRLLGRPQLGISVAILSMRDALWFQSRRAEVVPYGIPDPCPDYETAVLPCRRARLAARRRLLAGEPLPLELEEEFGSGAAASLSISAADAGVDPGVFRVLFLSNCMREKGLFDTLDAVALANGAPHSPPHLHPQSDSQPTGGKSESRSEDSLRWNLPVRFHLTVAGRFQSEEEKVEFDRRIAQPDLEDSVTYLGFVTGQQKEVLLRECDCLCFPTYHHAESVSIVVIEAMAAGMCIATTRWRALPEIMPAEYPGMVPVQSPTALAAVLRLLLTHDSTGLREVFLQRFSERRFLERLAAALHATQEEATRAS